MENKGAAEAILNEIRRSKERNSTAWARRGDGRFPGRDFLPHIIAQPGVLHFERLHNKGAAKCTSHKIPKLNVKIPQSNGFGLRVSHDHCDGQAKTLLVILDTVGSIFGGLAPVEWGSSRSWKVDHNLKSFSSMLKNRRNIPPRRPALKAEVKSAAIVLGSINRVDSLVAFVLQITPT
jgi:hypothetical protein